MHYSKAIYYDEVTKAFDDLRHVISNDRDDIDLAQKVLKIIDYLESHIEKKSLTIQILDLRSFDIKKPTILKSN